MRYLLESETKILLQICIWKFIDETFQVSIWRRRTDDVDSKRMEIDKPFVQSQACWESTIVHFDVKDVMVILDKNEKKNWKEFYIFDRKRWKIEIIERIESKITKNYQNYQTWQILKAELPNLIISF